MFNGIVDHHSYMFSNIRKGDRKTVEIHQEDTKIKKKDIYIYTERTSNCYYKLQK
jgi:hypothetical protein